MLTRSLSAIVYTDLWSHCHAYPRSKPIYLYLLVWSLSLLLLLSFTTSPFPSSCYPPSSLEGPRVPVNEPSLFWTFCFSSIFPTTYLPWWQDLQRQSVSPKTTGMFELDWADIPFSTSSRCNGKRSYSIGHIGYFFPPTEQVLTQYY